MCISSMNKLWMYVSFFGSCPILLFDFCYQVGLRYSTSNTLLIMLCLILGRITETTQALGTKLALFLFASGYMTLIFAQIGLETRRMWPLINKDARRLLVFSWLVFSSTWLIFPMLFVAQYMMSLSTEIDAAVHVFLDFMAKGVYSFGILRFRLCKCVNFKCRLTHLSKCAKWRLSNKRG